jgi:hypothetical protein
MARGRHAKRLFVLKETLPAKMCLEPEAEWAKLIGPAIEDYKKQNARAWLLQPRFKTDKPYFLFSREELRAGTYKDERPLPNDHLDSDGYFQLSAVGFGADNSVAVVWVQHNCGSLCGSGEFHVMHKLKNQWEPLEWRGMSCTIAY